APQPQPAPHAYPRGPPDLCPTSLRPSPAEMQGRLGATDTTLKHAQETNRATLITLALLAPAAATAATPMQLQPPERQVSARPRHARRAKPARRPSHNAHVEGLTSSADRGGGRGSGLHSDLRQIRPLSEARTRGYGRERGATARVWHEEDRCERLRVLLDEHREMPTPNRFSPCQAFRTTRRFSSSGPGSVAYYSSTSAAELLRFCKPPHHQP